MLLSSRDPRSDISSSTPHSQIPNILSTFRRSSVPNTIIQTTTNPQTTPRLPLASLDPQSAVQAGDTAMPSSASSLGYTQQDQPNDINANPARYHIGRHIVDTRITTVDDEEDTQNENPIASQTPTGLSPSRRHIPPAGSPSQASKSPAAVHLRGSPMSAAKSPLPQSVDVTSDKSRPNPAYLTNGDLYSNLATFSFGSPSPRSPSGESSSSPRDADAEVNELLVSPLTPMNRRASADRTPRPSVAVAAVPSKQPSNSHAAQGSNSTSSSRRTHNPSSSTSRPRISTDYRNPNYPQGDNDEDDDEGEEPVDFDYRPRRGRIMSDAVSRHTFGGRDAHRRAGSPSASVSSSRSGSRSSVRSGLEFSSEDEVELDYDSAHGTYTQGGLDADEELGVCPQYMVPGLEGRRGSLPMAIPGAGTGGDHHLFAGGDDDGSRNREDSLVTLRRPSRSLDDDLMMLNIGGAGDRDAAAVPKSEPLSRADWRSLEAQHQQQQQDQTQAECDVYDGLNLAYILDRPDGTTGSRRGSLAPSYVQTVSRDLPSRQSIGFKAGGWGAGLAWSGGGRRPSTATTGTANDDAFASHVKRFDGDYNQMASEWSFKMEKADGKRRAGSMAPGTQELWQNDLVGRFKVDRLALKSRSQDPRKLPQQRLNVRHIPDPFSKGNKRGGPSSVVHKHSKATAFSLFRHYGLLTRNATLGPGSPPMPAAPRPLTGTSAVIMLAPKKVQEQYTSTRTTSKLTTHGLLGDGSTGGGGERGDRSGRSSRPGSGGSGAQRAPSALRRQKKEKEKKERKEREKKQSEKDEKAKAKAAKKGHQKRVDLTESAESGSTVFSAQTSGSVTTKVEVVQRRHSAHQVEQTPMPLSSSTASTTSSSNEGASTATPSNVKRCSSFEIPRSDSMSHSGSNSTETHTLGPVDRVSENENTLMDRFVEDNDDEPSLPVTRTPHAEAFATLDPNVIEYVRSKNGNRMVMDGHSIHWSKRWIPGFGRPTKSSNAPASPAGTSSAALEATYHPPWMTIAGRKVQENNELLIQNLNDSFKDVGLLHSTFKPRGTKSSRKNKTGVNLFEEVPDDALYMLLPLWAGETDKASMPSSPAPTRDFIPLDQRQYLLVYYVPFESHNQEKSQEPTKKKTKSSLTSPESSLDSTDSKAVNLSAFRVSTRLVGYDELRGSGVRLPSAGLAVTGPVWEAQYAAPSGLSTEHHDDVIVATCYGREKGVEFLPHGLIKLGLCVVSAEMGPGELEPQVLLSPIGRAAAEMIWLGCMALTSFGAA